MTEMTRLFRMDNQPPLLQLIAAVAFTVIGGPLLFYLFNTAGAFIFSVPVDDMIASPGSDADMKQIGIVRFVQAFQQISLFIIPSAVIILLIRKEGESFTGMNMLPGFYDILPIVFLALIVIPVTTFLGSLNAGIDLPVWLSGTEEWISEKERQANMLTYYLLTSTDFLTLGINLLIMAVIPAIGEELFFRGILQRLLEKTLRSPHMAIWIVSILFSAIHLQFYGFIPRLLLGLIFGYMFYWSRNLWIPVIMHFFNNAVPVILSFREEMPKEGISFSEQYFREIPPPVIQIILVALLLWYLRRSFAGRTKQVAS